MGTLTNFEIDDLIKQFDIPSYQGCFYKNKLPSSLESGYYFVNLDNSKTEGGQGGTHWVLVIIPNDKNNKALYFDSFGLPPPKYVATKLRKWNKQHYFNNEIIQDIDTFTCGWYCLALLKYLEQTKNKKSMPHKVQDFIHTFFDDTKRNNKVLKNKHLKGFQVPF